MKGFRLLPALKSPVLWLWLAVLLGVALRLIYVLKTPFDVRAHDIHAHIDYIKYVAEHWWIPPAADGWEFHQSPLFYVFGALIWKAGALLQWEDMTRIRILEGMSFLLSISLLPLAVWIGTILFGKKHYREKILFVLIIAAFPALIYGASRVSNDLPIQILGFAATGYLLKWYADGKSSHWYLLCLMTGLGLITKVSFLLFLPVIGLCFLWKERWRAFRQWKRLGLSALLIALIAGWMPVVRMMEAERRSIIPDAYGLDPGVLIPNTIEKFIVFNPFAFVPIAYLNPWADESRRQFFWEYFFRSAFLGEWNFGDALLPLSSLLLIFGLGLLGLAIYGAVKGRDGRELRIPMMVLTGVMVLGAAAYHYVNTCSCTQDFRFSTVLVLPLAFFTVSGIGRLQKLPRALAILWIILFAIVMTLFVWLVPWAR